MKRLGGIWEEVTSMDNLRRAYNNAAKGKRSRSIVIQIGNNLDYYLEKIRQSLLDGTYKTSPYRTRVIYEPKRRVIYILPFYPDRIVHHAIMDVIVPYLVKRIDTGVNSSIKGVGQVTGSQLCMKYTRRYKYVLKCDISKFYPSIQHDIMMKQLERKIKDKRVLRVLDEIVRSSDTVPGETKGKNLPIGSYISQGLCNTYLGPLDTFVRHELKCNAYVRYCDDFVLFSNDKKQLHAWGVAMGEFLWRELKLTYSKCNIFPVTHGVDYLGYRHFSEYVLVRKRTAVRIKRRMFSIANNLRHRVINAQRYKGQIDSAFGWLKHANSWHLQKQLKLDVLKKAVEQHEKYQEVQ